MFAGSLPRGLETDVYAGLIREVRKLGVTTMIDTDGEPMRLAVRAEPDVVSPNELEAEELVGHEFNDSDDRAQAVVEMRRLGAAEAIMTVSDGCYAQVLEGGSPVLYRVRVEEQEARSSIGSGDAFLAGYVAARYAGRSAGRLPAVRGGLWRRVDPPRRRRDRRAGEGRADARRGRGRAASDPGRDLLSFGRWRVGLHGCRPRPQALDSARSLRLARGSVNGAGEEEGSGRHRARSKSCTARQSRPGWRGLSC